MLFSIIDVQITAAEKQAQIVVSQPTLAFASQPIRQGPEGLCVAIRSCRAGARKVLAVRFQEDSDARCGTLH